MDTKEMRKMRCEQTEQHMLEKIDKVLDDARDAGYLSREAVHVVKDCWKTIWYAKQCAKE